MHGLVSNCVGQASVLQVITTHSSRKRGTAELARHLAVRLRCYDILADEPAARSDTLPLFPDA